MRTKAIATLRTMTMWSVLLTVVLNELPVPAADSIDCSPPPYARRPSPAP